MYKDKGLVLTKDNKVVVFKGVTEETNTQLEIIAAKVLEYKYANYGKITESYVGEKAQSRIYNKFLSGLDYPEYYNIYNYADVVVNLDEKYPYFSWNNYRISCTIISATEIIVQDIIDATGEETKIQRFGKPFSKEGIELNNLPRLYI